MKQGDRAADFTLPDQHGVTRSLADLLQGGPLVLFFYPAAFTPGCTAEACHFRDLATEFAEVGATRAGISTDEVVKLAGFSEAKSFDYPLLSDADGSVAEAFGVKRSLLSRVSPVKRATFVIDTDRTILNVFSSEIRFEAHADHALEFLRSRVR